MLDVFNFPTPQGANYQEFLGGGTTRDWIKPRGASMVRMLLIGAGAGGRIGTTGTGGAGGSSGAIVQWIGPAIFIPDTLRIVVGAGGASGSAGGNATVNWKGSVTAAGYNLLSANGGPSNTAATATTNNYFGACGIFNSIAGQAGASANAAITASTTTFLSGGAGGNSTTTGVGRDVAVKYGYPSIIGGAGTVGGTGGDGFFITQPIMLGAGGAGGGGGTITSGGNGGKGGIGCGGGGGGIGATANSEGGRGGDGAVFIWSW